MSSTTQVRGCRQPPIRIRQLPPLHLTLVGLAAVLELPKEEMVDQPARPTATPIQLVSPCTSRERLVGHAPQKGVDELIDRDQHLEVVRMFHLRVEFED